jgi:hypothetical protein
MHYLFFDARNITHAKKMHMYLLIGIAIIVIIAAIYYTRDKIAISKTIVDKVTSWLPLKQNFSPYPKDYPRLSQGFRQTLL